MQARVYKTKKKEGLYLFINAKLKFTGLPLEVQTIFGKPIFVMNLDLANRISLNKESIAIVKQNLLEKGFHFQFPENIAIKGISCNFKYS